MVFKYTFSHFMDIATSPSSVQILKIKAGGEYVHKRCKHLFGVYKYFKLGSIRVKLVPASTLPVSPGGLAYASNDPQVVDPRDQMNPGLVRITNGESILSNLNGIDQETQRQMYLNTMLDPRWSKFMLQQGFKRTAIPLAYEVGNLKQTCYPDMVRNVPNIRGKEPDADPYINSTMAEYHFYSPNNNEMVDVYGQGSSSRGLFQLGHHKKIGWLPVDNLEGFRSKNSSGLVEAPELPEFTPIPTIDCITIILPMAYKTMFYYRLFVSETVYFDGVKNVGNGIVQEGYESEFRSFDNFVSMFNPEANKPSQAVDLEPFINGPNGGE